MSTMCRAQFFVERTDRITDSIPKPQSKLGKRICITREDLLLARKALGRTFTPVRVLRGLTIVFAVLLFAMLADTFYTSAIEHTQNLVASVIAVFGTLALAFLALASPGALEELSFGPFKAKWRIKELETRVESLQLAVLSLLTCHERSHLEKLAGDERGDDVQYRDSMYRELDHLRALGYLKSHEGSQGLIDMKNEFEHRESEWLHLKKYVQITALGRKYLELYASWAPKIYVTSAGEVRIGGKRYGPARDWPEIVDFAAQAGLMSEPSWEDLQGRPPERLKPPEQLSASQ
ncbi:hypothetical protein J2Z21_009565 [Streptomyces griseochromogenes]|uniref:Uncharacterized protein n=1 Tax=Streptomyces griseochromogenes TaxID=68214 RepID=A0A1B1AX00_9ACTN|nr:hypothetical protein [Streptomyces griseochromogenes]ANP51093.1 hypothetical protein AVL59_16995 [Streptomyces griseochromogenes]MBP2056546.1 hypothetical protein [Streptomyces griseochromogenes]